MTNNKLKSTQLGDELVRIDAVLEAVKRDEDAAHAEIKALARAAVQPDAGDALKQIKIAEGRLGSAKMSRRRLLDARIEVEADLAQTLAEEDQNRREADAAEAKAFAIRLGGLFAAVDARLAEFRGAYTNCVATVREGRARGWNLPSEELAQAKLNRALRTAFTHDELRGFDMTPLPPVERTSFGLLGEAYGRAIEGGALHMVKPSAPPPQPIQQAAKSDDRKLPPKRDVGIRLPGDGPDFTVRIPAAR